MTNTIILLSVLLQTNWQDTTVVHDGLQVQVGRVQTNYLVRPASGPYVIPRGIDFGAYPILTSQPFFGPYNLVRDVPQPRTLFLTNKFGDEIWWPIRSNGLIKPFRAYP